MSLATYDGPRRMTGLVFASGALLDGAGSSSSSIAAAGLHGYVRFTYQD